MSSNAHPIVCIGHSQVRCVAEAADQRGVALVAIDLWRVPVPVVVENGVPRFCEAIQRHLGAGPVFSLIGGNVHHKLGLLVHARPFDFVLPSEPDLPLDPRAELIPFSQVRAALLAAAESYLQRIQLLRQVSAGRVYQTEPPPVYPHEPRLSVAIRRIVPKRTVSGRVLRYKLWRLHCEVIGQFCEHAGVGLIPVPTESMDANGYLKSKYYKDPMHTSVEYGALVLDQIGAECSH